MSYSLRIIVAIFLLAVLYSSPLHAESFRGTIVKAITGDIVEVMHDGTVKRVRLARIQAPISDQPFGKAAAMFVNEFAVNRIVTVDFEDLDMNDMPVGELHFDDGTNLNKLIVASGYAWQHEGYGYSRDVDYTELEESAKTKKQGLWQTMNPIPPWEWNWVQRQLNRLGNNFNCSDKKYCHQMSSCEEAKLYMYACGNRSLDRYRNGIACEDKCRGTTQ